MSRYAVDALQACEPEELGHRHGITVTISDELDSMGFQSATIEGPTAEAVVEYVREHWGDEDGEWFDEYVVARVREVGAPDGDERDDAYYGAHALYADWRADRIGTMEYRQGLAALGYRFNDHTGGKPVRVAWSHDG